MIITTRVTEKQYIRLMFMLAYRKPVLVLLLTFDFLMMLWVLFYFLHWFDFLPMPEYPQYVAISLISIVQPLLIFLTIRKNYRSNSSLGNETVLTFTHEKLTTKRPMFYSELSWHDAYKLVEYKNWYLVYENTLAAVLIPKTGLSAEEEKEFRKLVSSIPMLKVELKK